MNALFLNRIAEYKHTELCFETSKNIIFYKIRRQNALLSRYQQPLFAGPWKAETLEHLLLLEARAAKHFWNRFSLLVGERYQFFARIQHGQNIVNKLLDIGYHHLTNKVRGLLAEQKTPMEIGLFHRAHRATATPLAYDLVELFRSDFVDREVLKFLRLKKRPLQEIDQASVRKLLFRINKRFEKSVYLKAFHQCHSLGYYMTLQIVHCIAAINHKMVFHPLVLPDRHEDRCP
ncbi:MAG: CRISPR-associated endonuclease Cas1 [Candidatus Moraniibacteriota bacterium]